MSKFAPKKQHLQDVLLHYYLIKKTAVETYPLLVDVYSDHAPSEPTRRYWFQRFKSGDFDVNDKERDVEESSVALDVDRSTVGKRLHALEMVQKAGNWVPHALKEKYIERRLVTCEMFLRR
ncbi:hypothetical protein Trydic_g23532 [Trypoxylus dichotomus]